MGYKTTVLLISLVAFSCTESTKKHTDEFSKTQKELTEKLTEISKTVSFNGFGVAAVNDKEVLYQNGFGMANAATNEKYTENTIQNIASVSKTFIGIAILKAQEMGKLKLDDPISSYLPFKVINPKYSTSPITIRHLVTHTASIMDNEEYLYRAWILFDTVNLAQNLKLNIGECKFSAPSTEVAMEEFLKNVLSEEGKWFRPNCFSDKKPGEIFNYSNMGATLAALVLEKATGEKFDAFTEKHILNPLKMESTGWGLRAIDIKKHSRLYINKTTPYPFYTCVTYPDGSIITSSNDMSKYIAELMKGYFGNGTILSKESYKEYFTPQLTAQNFINRSTSEYSDEYNMGITMGFGTTDNFGHTGGDPGMFSVIWFDKEKRIGTYFIVNTDGDNEAADKSQNAIRSLLDEYSKKLNELSKAHK
jgi:CubicO group peptidase (beta-lactamase class C family)